MTKKFNLNTIVLIGVFIALEIIVERMLVINVGNINRFSLGKVVVIVGGLWFGPIAGALIGGISDLLGAILQGYGIGSPIITLSSMVWGILPALCIPMLKNKTKVTKGVVLAVVIAITAVICSLVLTPIGLITYYHLEFAAIMPGRLLQFCVLSPAYIVVSLLLYFSPVTKMAVSATR